MDDYDGEHADPEQTYDVTVTTVLRVRTNAGFGEAANIALKAVRTIPVSSFMDNPTAHSPQRSSRREHALRSSYAVGVQVVD